MNKDIGTRLKRTKVMEIFRNLLLAAMLLSTSMNVLSLDFSRLGGTFAMSGDIKPGDYEKFVQNLKSWEHPPTIFWIESNGGSVIDAIKIGSLIKESFIPIWTGEYCHSSCFLIYASGVERIAEGDIGIHRVYYDKEIYSKLSASDARNEYSKLKASTKEYLLNIEVPQEVVEKMFSIASNEVHIYSSNEAEKRFGRVAPFYEEWLISKCGSIDAKTKELYFSIDNLIALIQTDAMLKDDSIPKSDSFGENRNKLLQKSELAIKALQQGSLEEHVLSKEKRQNCIDQASDSAIYDFFNKFKEIQ